MYLVKRRSAARQLVKNSTEVDVYQIKHHRAAGKAGSTLGLALLVALLISAVASTGGAAHAATVKPAAAPDQEPLQASAVMSMYIPLVATGGTRQTPPASPAPQPAPPSPASGALYLNRGVKTASASAAVDASGGMHAAYVHFVPGAEHPPAVYTSCSGGAARCADAANWRSVQLADLAREVQLQLTPAGQPRLLIVTDSAVYANGKDYWYAACDAGCENQAQWSLTRVAASHGTAVTDFDEEARPQRYFALDPQGRPRFLYRDRNYFYREPDHLGTYYVACDANCTDAANWTETRLNFMIQEDFRFVEESWWHPALAFTSTGQPRVIAELYAKNEDGSEAPSGLYYFECDGGCDSRAGWSRFWVLELGSGPSPYSGWDLELDAANRPHIALFTADGAQHQIDHELIYLRCDGDCLADSGWKGTTLGLPVTDGQAPDLELDKQARPRIAYGAGRGDLGYAWCDSACETSDTQWKSKVVETAEAMEAANPQALPLHCDNDLWHGARPVLALDAAGSPRIAYDVTVDARCHYKDPTNPNKPPGIYFERAWNAARWVYFP